MYLSDPAIKAKNVSGAGFKLEEIVDHVIWAGDFNYRVNLDKNDAIMYFYNQNFQVNLFLSKKLIEKDQLIEEKLRKEVFVGYEEAEIKFPPSYKYKKQSNAITDKNRVPSYTDRILHSGLCKNSLNILSYDSESEIVWSDHKPVFAQLEVILQNELKIL